MLNFQNGHCAIFDVSGERKKGNAFAVIFTWAILLKQLFSSLRILWNNPLDFILGIIPQYSLRLWRRIVKYFMLIYDHLGYRVPSEVSSVLRM